MDIKWFSIEFTFKILVIFTVQTLIASDIYDDDDEESGNWNRCPWIRNKLKNGRVKIRSRGRIAKFLCEPGYELAGKRFATCVRGQWNNPLPVCVSRGCSRPPHVDNARVTMMYRGAVLTYDCLPGYTLDGSASIYCDGRRWSGDPPTCVVSTSDPQTSCDFEDPDLCGWSHDPTHDFDWKRNQMSTPSGHVGTGPSFDHTFGEGKGGFYLFMEASAPRSVNDTARLFSPVYSSEYSGGCFIFWYHMFGSTTGGLRVYVKPESHVFGELPPVWALYGDQGNRWFRGNISLPHIPENFQIIIEGVRGSSYIGDTAIDDVSLNDDNCENIGNATDTASETFSDSCRGRCRESVNSSACGCNDECVALRSCCDDFESICTKNTETGTDETKKENSTEGTTLPTTISALETELPEVTKNFTTAISQSSTLPPISETTKGRTETPMILNRTANVSQSGFYQTVPSTYYPSSSTITSSTSISAMKPTTTSITTIQYQTSATTPVTTIKTTTTAKTPSTTTTMISTTPSKTTTTTSTTTFTTTTSSTTSTTSTTTAIPSTTTMKTTTSTEVSPTSTSTKLPMVINSSTQSRTTFGATTFSSWQSSSTATPSTRKIYNLRPRNRTTVSLLTATSPITTQTPTTLKVEGTTINTFTTSKLTTKSTSTPEFTTARSRIFTTTFPSKITVAPKASTNKFTIEQEIFTEKSAGESEAHASKTESVSGAGAPVITIVSVIIVLLICAILGALYFIRRWKAQKLSKLQDDSEMKFLSENEVVEYSDSSALDRINFNS